MLYLDWGERKEEGEVRHQVWRKSFGAGARPGRASQEEKGRSKAAHRPKTVGPWWEMRQQHLGFGLGLGFGFGFGSGLGWG